MGFVAGAGLQALRPRVQRVHGQGELPAEALPPDAHAHLGRHGPSQPERPDRVWPQVAGGRPALSRQPRHRHQRGHRGHRHPSRTPSTRWAACSTTFACTRRSSARKPSGRWNWRARSRTRSSRVAAAAATSPAWPSRSCARRSPRGKQYRIVGVEPSACPSLTKGELRYDFGDTAETTPLLMMYTLGHKFMPPSIHAGGLRYHGMSPMVSHALKLGLDRSRGLPPDQGVREATLFARTEGIVPAPESAHAIAAVAEEAIEAREAGRKHVFCLQPLRPRLARPERLRDLPDRQVAGRLDRRLPVRCILRTDARTTSRLTESIENPKTKPHELASFFGGRLLACRADVRPNPRHTTCPAPKASRRPRLPPPGLYLRTTTSFYYSTRMNDANGNEIGGLNPRAFIYAQLPRLIWITRLQFLGGNVGVGWPAAAGIHRLDHAPRPFNDHVFGIGDAFIEATWSKHCKQFDFALGFGVWVPTGDSISDNPNRAGRLLDPHVHRRRHLVPGRRPRSGPFPRSTAMRSTPEHNDAHPGQVYTVEGGLGYTLVTTLTLAPLAITSRRSRATPATSAAPRDRVAGIGPEINTFFPDAWASPSLRLRVPGEGEPAFAGPHHHADLHQTLLTRPAPAPADRLSPTHSAQPAADAGRHSLMTDAQWNNLLAAVHGQPLERPPVGFIIDCPWLPNWFGIRILDYFTNEELWFEANCKAIETFPEAIFLPGFWSEFGMCTEPSAFGAKCVFHQNEFPFADKIIRDPAQIDDLAAPNPGHRRPAALHAQPAPERPPRIEAWPPHPLLGLARPAQHRHLPHGHDRVPDAVQDRAGGMP